MYCNEKMKLNKFVQVKIPKNSEYFRRFNGNLPVPSNGQFSGDDVLPEGMTKNEQLNYLSRMNEQELARESEKSEEGAD